MAEENIDVRNKINQYEGLETLFIGNLPKCEYKSDVVIVFAHHLLTQELDYDCAEIQADGDENGEEKEEYKTMKLLPGDWTKGRTYKIIYKTEKETRILTAQKNSREFVVYFSKEGFFRNKCSSEIILKSYIPDQFMRSNDLLLIDNLSELRDILLKCFSKNDKIKAKQEHDKDLNLPFGQCGYSKVARRNPITDGERNTENYEPNNPLRNPRGSAKPAFHLISGKTPNPGNFCLQDKNKNIPVDEKRKNGEFMNDPNYIMQEDPEGPPDDSYIK